MGVALISSEKVAECSAAFFTEENPPKAIFIFLVVSLNVVP